MVLETMVPAWFLSLELLTQPEDSLTSSLLQKVAFQRASAPLPVTALSHQQGVAPEKGRGAAQLASTLGRGSPAFK